MIIGMNSSLGVRVAPQSVVDFGTITSGTAYANTSGSHLDLSLTVTLNPTLVAACSAVLEYNPGGGAWYEYARAEIAAGGVQLAGSRHQLYMRVPAAWSWRVTLVNASIYSYCAVG